MANKSPFDRLMVTVGAIVAGMRDLPLPADLADQLDRDQGRVVVEELHGEMFSPAEKAVHSAAVALLENPENYVALFALRATYDLAAYLRRKPQPQSESQTWEERAGLVG